MLKRIKKTTVLSLSYLQESKPSLASIKFEVINNSHPALTPSSLHTIFTPVIYVSR